MDYSIVLVEQMLLEVAVGDAKSKLKAVKSQLDKKISESGVKIDRKKVREIVAKEAKNLKPIKDKLKQKGMAGGREFAKILIEKSKQLATSTYKQVSNLGITAVSGGLLMVVGSFLYACIMELIGFGSLGDNQIERLSSGLGAGNDPTILSGLFVFGVLATSSVYLVTLLSKITIRKIVKA